MDPFWAVYHPSNAVKSRTANGGMVAKNAPPRSWNLPPGNFRDFD